jgi:exocyst complex component 4
MSFKVIYISSHSGVNLGGQLTAPINKAVRTSSVAPVSIISKPFSQVPKVGFEEETSLEYMKLSSGSPISPDVRPSRLKRFLVDLALRPNDPPHDLNDPGYPANCTGMPSGLSSASFPNLASTSASALQPALSTRNPESDSFAYIETLLESLAVLGKLGNALDVIAQRLPGEIFSLVETTLEEVGERAEYGRKGSMFIGTVPVRLQGGYTYSFGDSTTVINAGIPPMGGLLESSCLRLTALESSSKQVDHEILKDLFWTVYSKLDAVSQGLRVVFEVSNRVGSVS